MIAYNEPLAPCTTLRVGGPARVLATPENEEELVETFARARKDGVPVVILGRGSNVLFRDEGFDGVVIRVTQACRELRVTEVRGRFWRRKCRIYAGASVPLQELVRFCVQRRLDGPMYLHTVPGNVGGAIYMNAGTGVAEGKWISQGLVRVRVSDGGAPYWLDRDACGFGFRESDFARNGLLILGAEFEYAWAPRYRLRRAVRERVALVRRYQDTARPNAGSVFRVGYKHAPELSGLRVGDAMFSEKSANWIVNMGHATCADVLAVVAAAKAEHQRRGLPEPELEYCLK